MAGIRTLGRPVCAAVLATVAHDASALELSSWGDAFRNGTPTVNMRYRYETVDQDNPLRDARASTLRTRIGFATDAELPAALIVEAENVLTVGSERYNSTTNGRTDYSVVLDPEATEVNQAYLMLRLGGTQISAGRRRMVLDNGRFLGNVGFRQNEQTYDAVVLMNTQLPGHRFIYAYMDKARRFFGDDSPRGELDMTSHFLNYRYEWLSGNELVAYAYLLEMDPAAIAGASTKSFGLRLTGGLDLAATRLLYTLEYADQSPYADGNDRNDADYLLAEAGARLPSQWVAKLGVETLGGDGQYGFQTQLATAHAFAGDADIFAGGTPVDGLVDRYAKLAGPIGPVQFRLAYHDFVADSGSADYGTEWDAGVTWAIDDRFTVGAQFAAYDAKQFAVDTDKAWLWVSFRY